MDQLKVKDRILENISLSVKKLQSYFAACEDETPAIRNHDRVLQRLCEHLDHALLYGLQDISSGYWVLVLHFTRREAVRQIDELQHIATNLGRSRAWLYLALSESSLESYLRLFQENQGLLQKYYYKNALVCSHDHLTLFLTLVSGLEFIRFDLELDVPYLDVAPYMPEYYKPHNLLDFEERLPSSDSLSLHSFTSLTSTNLEWDDSAIAPSSEGELLGFSSPFFPSISLTTSLSRSPTFRHNPFNEDSDTNTSADVTPVHMASRHASTTGEDAEISNTELEVIRCVLNIRSNANVISPDTADTEECLQIVVERDIVVNNINMDSRGPLEGPNGLGSESARNGRPDGEDEDPEAGLRLPEMTDTSMDSVGEPLRDVMDRLNGSLDGEHWHHDGPPHQRPFREDSGGEPPDPSRSFLQAPLPPVDFYCFTSQSPDPASSCGGHNDSAGNGESQDVPVGDEDEGEAETPAAGQDPSIPVETSAEEERSKEEEKQQEEDKDHTVQNSHAAEFKVDNNHLLLLMIHVFRENEEQLFKMVRMSTGHMEGDLQPLYLLVTDCYIYLLRKGAAEKPYSVEEVVSYNELDYISVGLLQQTITLVCTNRRRQFLLDTADSSLTVWFLTVLKAALENGCREPPYPSVLTDATMEKLALSKFVCQETHCELSEMSIRLYSLVHWEDPMDVAVASPTSPSSSRESSSTKEGALLYRAGSTYLGKEVWKSCYLVLSNGILYQYAERTDVTPLMSVTMGGGHCGGCRRSNSSEKPHAFQVILTEHPPLELSAENELEMADWMQLLCQSVSKGIIPQGVAPAPCIPCCLVLTDRKLLTCHQDCQTSFFRSLGGADLNDVTAVCLEDDKEYCVIEFAEDRAQFLPPWVLYFSGCEERDRLLAELSQAWAAVYQHEFLHMCVQVSLSRKEALELMKSAWQRSDSLHRGRSEREPWC
uniref:Pleckstrin homology domain-containing family M member 2 n=1 Tax=Sinocyclocheilus rhinocerous TaxID=307959 RepID=A0A673LB36_9TELE